MKTTNRNLFGKMFLLFIFMLLVSSVGAQKRNISGVVKDSDGQLLPGVSILVEGTNVGTITNLNGSYTLNVNADASSLVFSFIGMKKMVVSIGKKSVIDVVLSSDAVNLDEVVAIGYGTAKRKDLTGAVATISADDIDKIKSTSFENSIAGKVSGVQVVSSEGGPDAAMKIKIRGSTSINASNDPLYVIDGFPISGEGVSTATGMGNSTANPLSSLDPSTIESIDVLKDASATAIYGSRGANGVIIITTKKGKSGAANFNFETYTSVSSLYKKLDVLTPQEFINFRNDYQPWSANMGDSQKKYLAETYRVDNGTGNFVPVTLDYTYPDGKGLIIDDWQDQITRNAFTRNYLLTANGGDDKSRYNASISYLNTEGIIKTSGLERFSMNMNVNQTIGKRIKTGFNLNAGYTMRSGIVTASTHTTQGRSGVISSAILFGPIQPVRHRNNDAIEAGLGIVYDENGRMIANQNGDVANPLAILENNKNFGKILQSRFNAFIDYKIRDGLQFKSSLRGFVSDTKNQAYYSETIGWSKNVGGSAVTNFANNYSLVAEQNLSFNKKFKKQTINAVLVSETQLNNYEYLQTSSQGFELPGLNLDNLQSALVTLPVTSNAYTSTLQSYLTRVNYDAFNKYIITASARLDGSSRFAKGNQWGFFPSVGVAWRMSSENFLKNVSFISDAKLRASYGETGNNEIGSYRSLARAGLASYIFNGSTLATGASISNLANPDLTWEKTKQADIGFSVNLFRNRISLEADYYDKKTSDLLLEVPLPSTSGYRTAFKNLGIVSNKGLEFAVTAYVVESKNFKWKSNVNISFNRNKVLDLGGASQFFVTAIGDNAIQSDYVVRVGESLGSIFGLKDDGVYNFSDFVEFDGMSDTDAAAFLYSNVGTENWYSVQIYNLKPGVVKNSLVPDGKYRPGMSKFVDYNQDGVINDEDRHIIGNTQPLHFGGFTNDFSYKGLDLSIQTSWSYGNDVYNKNIKRGTETSNPWNNKLALVNERWDPEHPNNTLTSFNSGASGNFSSAAYSRFIEDGSYFRIGNITMGYKFNKKFVSSIGLKGIRVYSSIDNVLIFTKYSGWDPDVSVGNNQLTPGLDIDSYPRARTFRLGVNVNL